MKSIYENEMKLEFVSKSNNEAFARISVAAFAAQLDPTVEELADIKTAEMPIVNQKEEQLKKDKQKFKLPNIKDMNFGTTVHESLKREEE